MVRAAGWAVIAIASLATGTALPGEAPQADTFDWRIVLRSDTGSLDLLPWPDVPAQFDAGAMFVSADERTIANLWCGMRLTPGSMPGLSTATWTFRGQPWSGHPYNYFSPDDISINGSPLSSMTIYGGRGPCSGNALTVPFAWLTFGTPDGVSGVRSKVTWEHIGRKLVFVDPVGVLTVKDANDALSFEVTKVFQPGDTPLTDFSFDIKFEVPSSMDPRPLAPTQPVQPANGAVMPGVHRNFIWNATLNATDYFLYIDEDQAFTDFVSGVRAPIYVRGIRANTPSGTVPSYSVQQSLLPDRQYFWKVVARNAFFETNALTTPVNSFRNVTTPPPPPPPPTQPGPLAFQHPRAGTPNVPQNVTLSWSPSADIARYSVIVTPQGHPPLTYTLPAGQTSLALPPLRAATRHEARVVASDDYAQERPADPDPLVFTTRACLDLDGDFTIGTIDLTVFLSSFGMTVPAYTSGDADGDAVVATTDLVSLLAQFGGPCR